MVQHGHVHNGVIVPEAPEKLPEGATVLIEVIQSGSPSPAVTPRLGGIWKGQVRIAEDFDELPPDIAEAFGMGES